MFPEKKIPFINNEKGVGLIAAIFTIVILALFGLLTARFVSTGSQASAEDYLWAQAIYSAEAAARLRILNNDNGGNWGTFAFPGVAGFTTNPPVTDIFTAPGNPAILRIQAHRANISREIQVKYIL